MNFILSLIPDNVRNAAILAVSRHLISSAAGGLLVFLLANHATQSQASDISQAASALALALVSYGCSLLDVKKVDTKIKLAENTVPPHIVLAALGASPIIAVGVSQEIQNKPDTNKDAEPNVETHFKPVHNPLQGNLNFGPLGDK